MTISELRLRSFEVRDQEAARWLILHGLGEHFGYIDESLNPDLDDITQHYIIPGHAFLVACLGEEIVGTGALVPETEGVCEIVRISTHQDHRRNGIGKSIVELLTHIARERGYRRVFIKTRNNWEDAIGLYTHLGFTVYKRTENGVYMGLELLKEEQA